MPVYFHRRFFKRFDVSGAYYKSSAAYAIGVHPEMWVRKECVSVSCAVVFMRWRVSVDFCVYFKRLGV